MSITPRIDFTAALSGLFDLRGKTADVPGGYGGIGEAIACGLALAGARVAASGRDESKALAAASALQATGHEAIGLAMDAHSAPQIQASVDTVAQQFGRLAILVNRVGMQREQTLLDVTEETFDEVVQVNLKAAMFLAQAVAKKQIAGVSGGAQVHLLSVRAQLGMRGRGYSAYCSSKNGLVMLIRQHASELAPHGITVNGIAPTVVRTEMARHWLENSAPPCFSRRRRRRSSPARCCTWTAASRRRIRSSQQPTAASSPCVSTIRGRPTAPLPAY